MWRIKRFQKPQVVDARVGSRVTLLVGYHEGRAIHTSVEVRSWQAESRGSLTVEFVNTNESP